LFCFVFSFFSLSLSVSLFVTLMMQTKSFIFNERFSISISFITSWFLLYFKERRTTGSFLFSLSLCLYRFYNLTLFLLVFCGEARQGLSIFFSIFNLTQITNSVQMVTIFLLLFVGLPCLLLNKKKRTQTLTFDELIR
jgi:hypothetical protein